MIEFVEPTRATDVHSALFDVAWASYVDAVKNHDQAVKASRLASGSSSAQPDQLAGLEDAVNSAETLRTRRVIELGKAARVK
jgi:hypothetical protein